MAGLIIGHGRILGVAPKARILPVRAKFSEFGVGSAAADWAIENGARVLCLAYGEADSPGSRATIQRAIDRDIVVVAGVGNEPHLIGIDYPAGYPGVVGAAAVDKNGSHAAISVVSKFATLSAPGVDVYSTDIRTAGHNGYRVGTGTSDATAIIAGAAALVRAKFPKLSAAEVIHRLTATADDKGPPGRDDEYGYGVINLVKALTADVPSLQSATPTTPSTSSQAAPAPNDQGVAGETVLIVGALVIIAVLGAAFVAISIRQRRR